ncbi:MAG TPA: hypothetical protein VLH86_05730 [Patescibacteria group bacterium]|nr:hypothetical protein [Patescibacteria group bacterium]
MTSGSESVPGSIGEVGLAIVAVNEELRHPGTDEVLDPLYRGLDGVISVNEEGGGPLGEVEAHLLEAVEHLTTAHAALHTAAEGLTAYVCEVGVDRDHGRRLYFQDIPTFEARPDTSQQSRFFGRVFRDASPWKRNGEPAPYSGRSMGGTFMGDIRAVWESVDTELTAISDSRSLRLDLSFLLPKFERPVRYESLSQFIQDQLAALRAKRLAELRRLGREVFGPVLKDQKIEPGVLSVPPYFQQGDNGDPDKWMARVGCMNACFRMVFGGISGWRPDELMVGNAIINTANRPHEHTINRKSTDAHYMQVFHTERFRETFPGQTTTRIITGADLATIASYASAIRQKRPNAQVYCIAKVGTETDDLDNPDKAHAVVLTGADADYVYCHDPAPFIGTGKANRRMLKSTFAQRWAVGYNTALLVVHIPAPGEA